LETYSEQNIPHEKLTIWNRFRIESVPFFLAPKGMTREGALREPSQELSTEEEKKLLSLFTFCSSK
jgi:hypothetical protein